MHGTTDEEADSEESRKAHRRKAARRCPGYRGGSRLQHLPRSGQSQTAGAAPADLRYRYTTEGVGALEETLKWGQPSYLTTESKSGSTVRIDQVKAEAGRYAVYFHCQTDLVETFRELYPDLRYGGNRSIILDAGEAARESVAPLHRAGADVSCEEAEGGEIAPSLPSAAKNHRAAKQDWIASLRSQ